ncbi:MAG: ribonuclease E [Alphaproteobacteria bacterium]|nr:ribonuclease E [Alphaproteobacteria bacterium]
MDILIEELENSLWAVALDQGRIEALEIDTPFEAVRWGSIYWAKVARIDAAQDAAFLNLDGENIGILYNRDVRIKQKDGTFKKGGDEAIGKILHPGQMIAVQAKTAYIEAIEEMPWEKEDKQAQVSMDITLPGRYLIYCAHDDCQTKANHISSRIRDKKLRKQMETMINSIDDMRGLILRASAADLQTEILRREARLLREMWQKISAYFDGESPSLIALGPDSIQRTLSDLAGKPIEHIEVVTMDHFAQVEEWCSLFAPDLMTKITPVELDDAAQDLALLHYRDVLGQIEALLHDYAFLPNGGNLIIQETAALTSIDVNSGNDKRAHLAVNIEAAHEIGRQMRLRNSGGIVVVDFLNMNVRDQKMLLETLDEVVNADPCTVQIHGFTKLGLMEITRRRRTPRLHDRFEGLGF